MRKKFGEVQIKRYMYADKRRLANYHDNLFAGFNSACFVRLAKASVRGLGARETHGGREALRLPSLKIKDSSAGYWLG